MKQAAVSEIYASVQGEGPFTGEKQIFVRLAGCPLRCHYCDTPASLIAKGHPQKSVNDVVLEVLRLSKSSGIKTVSITGGEPLVQVGFLEELLPLLHKKKFRIYLETAGIHPENLRRILKNCDVVAMDFKLPGAVGRNWWPEHRAFLKIAGAKAFVKIVIDSKSRLSEIKKAVLLVASIRKTTPVVLQPATEIPDQVKRPNGSQLAEAYRMASMILPAVLVMPQQHKIWGVR